MNFSLLLDSKFYEGRDSICAWYIIRLTECLLGGTSNGGSEGIVLLFLSLIWGKQLSLEVCVERLSLTCASLHAVSRFNPFADVALCTWKILPSPH